MYKTKIKNIVLIVLLFLSFLPISYAIYWETWFIWWDNITFKVWYSWDWQKISNETLFNKPWQVIYNSWTIYISDTYNNCIRYIKPDWIIDTLVWNCSSSWSYAEWTWKDALFYNPKSIAINGDILYVSDFWNHKIRWVNLTTKTTFLVAWNTLWYAEWTWNTALFSFPYGIVYKSWFLYVADSWNNKIRKINLSDNTTSFVAWSWNAWTTNSSNPNTIQFDTPISIDIKDDLSTIFVWDLSTVRKYDVVLQLLLHLFLDLVQLNELYITKI